MNSRVETMEEEFDDTPIPEPKKTIGHIECDYCMSRYSHAEDKCPNCGSLNYIKYNQWEPNKDF